MYVCGRFHLLVHSKHKITISEANDVNCEVSETLPQPSWTIVKFLNSQGQRHVEMISLDSAFCWIIKAERLFGFDRSPVKNGNERVDQNMFWTKFCFETKSLLTAAFVHCFQIGVFQQVLPK